MIDKPADEIKLKNGVVIVCIAVGCKEKTYALGYCLKHYKKIMEEEK